MNILSLFDGISCGRVALDRAGITVGKYYAAEIDKYATKVSEKNYPDIIRLGDVLNWRTWDIDWSSIDMVFAGFPCQAWSVAGKQLGDKDERGMLFWTMLDIIQHVQLHNPSVKYLIENVKMKKEFEEYITYHTEQALGGVHKILINSALVSAQSRPRYYWVSKSIAQPRDKEISMREVIQSGDTDEHIMPKGWHAWWSKNKDLQLKKRYSALLCFDDKAICMTARQYASWNGNFIQMSDGRIRKLTPIECERLQTLPDDYTAGVSNTQRYKAIGNGWTVDVIAHILKGL